MDNLSYKEKYYLIGNGYESEKLPLSVFSEDLNNLLLNSGVFSVSDLINLNDDDLNSILPFKLTVIVQRYIKSLIEVENQLSLKELLTINDSLFNEYVPRLGLSNRTTNALMNNRISDINSLIRLKKNDLLKLRRLGNVGVQEIVDFLTSTNFVSSIDSLDINGFDSLCDSRKNAKLQKYMGSYEKLHGRLVLEEYGLHENNSLSEAISIFKNSDNFSRTLYSFLTWCSTDIKSIVDNSMIDLYKNDQNRDILLDRSRGKTLQEIGDEKNLTRERIRQIEKKSVIKFKSKFDIDSFITLSSIETDNNSFISYPFLSSILESDNNRVNEFVYLINCCDYKKCRYINAFKALEINGFCFTDVADTIKNEIPSIINKESFFMYKARFKNRHQIDEKPFLYVFNMLYKTSRTKSYLYRGNLKQKDVIEKVLSKHFSTGIYVYNDESIAEFRRKCLDEFPEVSLPETDRALVADICRQCILCGKGKYKLKTNSYIDNSLKRDIWYFIKESETDVIMTQSIYDAFKARLNTFDIFDRHHLQGVLRELFGDKLQYHKSYISKNRRVKSLYQDILNFIYKSKYPITKNEIRNRYKGITDIVIALATTDKKVLNYGGEYMYTGNIKLDKKEVLYLRNIIDEYLSHEQYVNCRVLFDDINKKYPNLLKKLCIFYQSSLFSVLEYLFSSEYQFSRPYVGVVGCEIGHPSERILALVENYEQFKIPDIRKYINKNRINISLIDALNSLNDRYFIFNDQYIVSIDSLNIDEKCALELEKEISKHILSCSPIAELEGKITLPLINGIWSEWLIYSVLNKWSSSLDVDVTNKKFVNAIPLVSLKGKMHIDNYSGYKRRNVIFRNKGDYNTIEDAFLDSIEDELINDEF